ncbi:MAG TPA: glycosyltransferase, partial [Dehalococcoidia bacterium]|nr:glycosyltransferase [Dehalococcoidia bacterium]
MRVAVISVHTSPLARPGGAKAGGLNVYVLELARELASAGCEVDIFSRAASPDVQPVIQLEKGLRAIHLTAGPRAPLTPEDVYEHLDAFERELSAFVEVDGRAYDVIHSHYWLSGLIGELLKAAWHVPHVTMFHTLG